jgi:hypothetical protein
MLEYVIITPYKSMLTGSHTPRLQCQEERISGSHTMTLGPGWSGARSPCAEG